MAITNAALFIVFKGPPQLQIRPVPLAVLAAAMIGCVLSAVGIAAKSHLQPERKSLRGSEDLHESFAAPEGQQRDENPLGGLAEQDPSVATEEKKEEAGSGDGELTDVEKPFVPLLIVSALSVAFAHGGNDVGNAVGPLASLVEVYRSGAVQGQPEVTYWELSVGAAGFVCGIMALGSRTIETVGSGLCKNLNPPKAFAMQTGAAIAVLGSSAFKLPVSTSHCLVRFLRINLALTSET